MIILALLAIIVAVAWPALHRARIGGLPIKDANNIASTHKAMLVHAQSNGGELPRPSRIAARGGTPDRTLDTTASMLSLMLAERSIEPSMLIGLGEENPVVQECDYNFAAIDPAAGRLWDPGFRTDLDAIRRKGVSHTSYAHLALCGARAAHWRNVTDSTVPLYGDRGTTRGVQSGAEWSKSYTLLRYDGSGAQWQGNLVYADNHTEASRTFYPTNVVWACGTIGSTKDNIFDCEFNQADCTDGAGDGRVGGDIWLCITQRLEGAAMLAVDVQERLTDGTLPPRAPR